MLKLRLLGGAALENEGRPLTGKVAQRRRLAFLALLAGARNEGISREKLTGYLWPESETDRARHLLSESLYVIHKALGKDAVLAVGDVLRLNPEALSSDAGEFEEALRRGDLEPAVSAYRGPFLDGFYLAGAPEFERWAEAKREDLARKYAKAVESLAEQAMAGGDFAASVEWWRRLATHDPYSSRFALGLMRALDLVGDRAAALQHARTHSVLLREEFEAEPDPEVMALAEKLRREPVHQTSSPRSGSGSVARSLSALSAPEPVKQPGGVEYRSSDQDYEQSPGSGEHGHVPGADRPHRQRPWEALQIRPYTVVLLLLLLFTSVLGVWNWRDRRSAAPASDSSRRIAVFPFSVRGSDEVAYLGEGIVDLLSTNLNGAGDLQTVDSRALLSFISREHVEVLDPARGEAIARRFGAGSYILGQITEVGGRLRLSAALYDRQHNTEPVAEVKVEGPVTGIFEMVDRLAAQLLAARYGGPAARLTRLAALTTTSLPALKAYLQGERAFRQDRYEEAAEALQQALAIDSTFALAAYRLSTVATLGVDEFTTLDVGSAAAEHASRFSTRLPPTVRMLVDALRAFYAHNPAEAKRIYQSLLARDPSNVEAWYRLGEVEFHENPLLGLSPDRSRASFERVLAFDPGHQPARAHLATLAARVGDRTALDTILPRLLADAPEDSLKWLHLRAFALDDTAAQAHFVTVYPTLGDSVLWSLARDLLEGTTNFGGAQRVARHMTNPSRPMELREAGHLLLAWLEMVHGRPSAAEQQIAAVEQFDRPAALEYRAVFAIPHFLPVPEAELRTIRDSLAAWEGTATENPYMKLYTDMWPSIRQYLLALLSARLADDSGVERHLAALEPKAPTPGRLRVTAQRKAAVLARVAATRGDPAVALDLLERTRFPGVPEEWVPSVNFLNFFERHLRPGLLAALGREDEALRWYGAAPWTGEYFEETLYDWVHLAPFHFERAKILERMGRRQEAALHYARFVALWRNADPELRPMVFEAQRRLALLRVQGPAQ